MFRLNLSEQDGFCNELKKFVSALLPHEKGDNSLFSTVLGRVLRLLPLEEFELGYYLVFGTAVELEKIYFQTGGNPIFSREVLDSVLQATLYDVVKADKIGVSFMMELAGLPSNLLVEETAQEAMNKLYALTMEIYDEAFEMQIAPEAALGFLPALRSQYVSAVGVECVRAQAWILDSSNNFRSKRFEGWHEFLKGKNFSGAEGWMGFISYVSSELSIRIRESEEIPSPLKTLEQAEKLRQEAIFLGEQIAEYGIPPIDQRKGIIRSGYSILIGKRGLGKTTIAINFAVNVFMNGGKILMINEETSEASLLYEYLIPVYVYKRFGFFATYKQILGEEEITGCSQEEIAERKKLIQMAIIDFTESGRYMYVRSVNAWRVYDELSKLHSQFDFDYAVIDHSLSMPGGGETTPRLETMSKGIKEFKLEFGKHVLLLSHASPKAAKVKSTSDMDGLTRYSSQLEGDADQIFFLFETEQLAMRGLVACVETKARGAEKELSVIYLTKVFAYKLFLYDVSVQEGSGEGYDILGDLGDEDYSDEDYESDLI